jgi:hypothetical protein
MKFPTIAIAVEESLEEAMGYVVERFEEEGFTPQSLEEVLGQLPCAGRIGLLSVTSLESLDLFVVVTAAWEEDLMLDIVQSMLLLRQSANQTPLKFHFISGYPVPSLVNYLFADTPQGYLEGEAILEIQGDPETPIPGERATYLARQAQRWLQNYFHHTLYPTQIATLTWLQQWLTTLDDDTYEPVYTLILAGYLVGEVMIHQPQIAGRWLPHPVMGGVLLELCPQPQRAPSWLSWREPPTSDLNPEWERAILVNPIALVLAAYHQGVDLEQEVKTVLETWANVPE